MKHGIAAMKLAGLLFVALGFQGFAEAGKSKQEIAFDGERYVLQYAKLAPLSGGYLNEYIRDGETVHNYTKMIGLHHYPMVEDPLTFARLVVVSVMKSNPKAKYSIVRNDKTGEVVVDFLTWAKKGKQVIVEFNIFRFRKFPARKGLLGYQFVFRNDGSRFEEYQRELLKNKTRWVRLVMAAEYPELVEEAFGE